MKTAESVSTNLEPEEKVYSNVLTPLVRRWWNKKTLLKKNGMSVRYLGINLIGENGKVYLLKNEQINKIHESVLSRRSYNELNGEVKIGGSYYSYCHVAIKRKAGKACKCENEDCPKKSNKFEWALIKGRQYSDNPDDYISLCAICHRKYDLTEKTLQHLRTVQRQTILTEKQAREVKQLIKNGLSNREIADIYNVNIRVIYAVKVGLSWSSLK